MLSKLSIIFTVLLGSAFTKDFWECDAAGQMKCATTNTCCRSRTSPYGWACYPIADAVCCSDGVNVCPPGTVCDLTDRTCRRNSLSFLQTQSEIQAEETTYTKKPILALNPSDAKNFTYGFYQGIEVFTPLLRNSTCLPDSDKILNDVLTLADLIANFDSANLRQEILIMTSLVEDMLVVSETQVPACLRLGKDLKDLFRELHTHFMSGEYLEGLASHTLFNIGKIHELYQVAVKDAKELNYFEAGKGFGQLVRFAALWDF